jgi:hypothetical protein
MGIKGYFFRRRVYKGWLMSTTAPRRGLDGHSMEEFAALAEQPEMKYRVDEVTGWMWGTDTQGVQRRLRWLSMERRG